MQTLLVTVFITRTGFVCFCLGTEQWLPTSGELYLFHPASCLIRFFIMYYLALWSPQLGMRALVAWLVGQLYGLAVDVPLIKHTPSHNIMSQERRYNVAATSWRCTDGVTTLAWHFTLPGLVLYIFEVADADDDLWLWHSQNIAYEWNQKKEQTKHDRNYTSHKLKQKIATRSFFMVIAMLDKIPASILRKSTSGRHRPVSYPDGPMTARYRFT